MNLKNIYYFFSSLYYRRVFAHLGKGCQLRLGYTILHGEFIYIGENFCCAPGLICATWPEYANKKNRILQVSNSGIHIGANVSINRNCTFHCAESITVGDDCLFGSYILVTDNNHGMNASSPLPYKDQPLLSKPVSIGKGCWVGERVSILAGAQIGDQCIIAAGSIVTGIFPPRCILAGTPAQIIKVWDENSNCWRKNFP